MPPPPSSSIGADGLRLPDVGGEQDVFDRGGHSRLLAQVQRRLRSKLGEELSILELFQCPTVRAVAGRLAGRRAVGARAAADAPGTGGA